MTEVDLDRAILEDRKASLPGQPDLRMTLAAVKRKVSLEEERSMAPEIRGGSSLPHLILCVSGAATALGAARLLVSSGSPCLWLIVPFIQSVALKTLIKEGAKP